jgi:hypothetical protein
MSEPTRTSAAQRMKLATALKRNMARRKAASLPLPSGEVGMHLGMAGEGIASTKRLSEPCVAEGKPRSGWGQRSVGAKEAPSIKGEA